MASVGKKTHVTPEAYLARERLAETRSEYYDGQVYAMAGSSLRHNKILGNVFYQLRSLLDGRDWQVTITDIRLRNEASESYTYPDLMVICGEPQFADGAFDTVVNPTLIVEILSPSTESWNRGGKFEQYRTLRSLQDYVLVSQGRRSVEHYSRGEPEEVWGLTKWELEEDVLSLRSVGCDIPLREIYGDITFAG